MGKWITILIGIFIFISILSADKTAEDPFNISVKKAEMTPDKAGILSWLESNKQVLYALNEQIWEYAEEAMEEYDSSEALAGYLETQGFKVVRGVAGMPTAFTAEYGKGEPVIGILAEYDALPGLSQDKVPVKKSAVEGRPGHGCGHNIFGVASAAAAAALKHTLVERNISGTIRLFGCPAEETVVGKVFMAREGIFDGLSCCIQWHPGSENEVSLGSSNALNQFEVEFFGKTSHAAGDPWNGRSALDAVELTNVGLNYLREHLKPTARIHYVIKQGGQAPNVVPDYSRAWYYVRDIDRKSVEENYARVLKIIEAAAMMTDTRFQIRFISGVHEKLPNRTGNEIVYSNLLLVGPPSFSKEDQDFARAIQKNLGIPERGLSMEIEPLRLPERSWGGGSTDVAEVSWLTPTTSLEIAYKPLDSPGHHWAAVACAGTSIGNKCMLTAAKVMALSGIDFLLDPEIIRKMRKEWEKKKGGKTYVSPLPPDIDPPIKPKLK